MSNRDNPEAEALLRRALIFEANVNHRGLTAHHVEQLIVSVMGTAERVQKSLSDIMAHPSFPGAFVVAFKSDRGL